MPKSKHRHKREGKAISHPGRGKVASYNESRELKRYRRFKSIYTDEFYEQFRDSMPEQTGYLLDILSDEIFDLDTWSLQTGSKSELFDDFIHPIKGTEPSTTEMAENALAFLVQHEMICIDGDDITIHPRFHTLLRESEHP
jgi:hypothetical protein